MLIPTLRDAPKEAELISHKLLVRAGFIRSAAAGIYTLLPLGQRVRLKIEKIIREEMDAIGGQEISMPIVQPAELWQESGRWYQYGPELVRFKDRAERELILATTHEEAVTDIVRREIRSYRQVPLVLYQIQTKFRDEPRPRGGLIRVREFTMKDAYSFHSSEDDLDAFYPKIRQAYEKIFRRCGLDPVIVQGDPGLIGGRDSHEFMVLSDAGEDQVALCEHCGYAANRGIAKLFKAPANPTEPMLPLEEVATPGCESIQALSEFLKIAPSRTAKAVFCVAHETDLLFAVIRGDLEVSETKLANAIGARTLRTATEAEIRSIGAVPGYASPVGLPKQSTVKIIVDDSVIAERNLVSGANREGFHLKNVNYGRDFIADVVADIALAREGDPCLTCQSPLVLKNALELGHIFKLGTRYSEAMGAKVLTKDGSEKFLIMGCYGIGVGRLLAAVVEAHHDEKGIIWPEEIAPFQIILLVLNTDRAEQTELAEKMYALLRSAGLEVLYDDRAESAGVKFNDADLIGIPYRITIGPRNTQNKTIELRRRRDGAKRELSYAQGLDALVQELRAELARTPQAPV
ncbi:MAG: proline--tRNA ligase [Candidatus Bipolaricaulota bacterium]|nr:proline--tRNA ligase [Candidatus Bipolaricaulota bacterium]